MYKKFLRILSIITVCFVLSAYKFPEQLPNWQNIQSYKMANLKFGLTTVNQFQELVGSMSRTSEGSYVIFSEKAPSDQFKSLRVGFKNDVLDFIEFELKDGVKVKEITSLYGSPVNVNTEYSTMYDYLDYDFFNLMSDKQHDVAYAMTLFKIPEFNSSVKSIIAFLPDYRSFNFINKFIPGEYLENDFMENFSGVIPVKKHKFDTDSYFTVESKYLKSNKYYDEASFYFRNGVLNFISLSPKSLNYSEVQKIYGKGSIKQPASKGKFFVEYSNFILLIDERTNRVINVGIVSSM